MKLIKFWLDWIRLRPAFAVFMAFILGIGVGVLGMADAREQIIWLFLGMWTGTMVARWMMDRHILAALLSVLLVVPPSFADEPEPQFEPAAGPVLFGVGIGLLVGGGYLTVRIIKACHKRHKQMLDDLKAATNDVNSVTIPGNPYAGFVTVTEDYCGIEPASEPASENGVQLVITVHDYGDPTIDTIRHVDDRQLGSWDEFAERFRAKYGVEFSGNTTGDIEFTQNGVPVPDAQVPVRLEGRTLLVYPEQIARQRFVVETTHAIGEPWGVLAQFDAPNGTRMNFCTTSEGQQAFYRVRLVQ